MNEKLREVTKHVFCVPLRRGVYGRNLEPEPEMETETEPKPEPEPEPEPEPKN